MIGRWYNAVPSLPHQRAKWGESELLPSIHGVAVAGIAAGACVVPLTLTTKTKQGHLIAYPSRLLTMASDLKCNLWGLRLNLKEREK